jgi:hypothetical protein
MVRPVPRARVNRQKHESDNAMADAHRGLKPMIVNSAELDQPR